MVFKQLATYFFFGAHLNIMELGARLTMRHTEPTGQTLAILLSALTFAATCSAQFTSGEPADGLNHPADFTTVLRVVTYCLMGASTLQLLVSALAILRMPQPRCLCYTVPYSDIATCFGNPCCSCANLRQLSATMILVWSVLLMCQLSMGMDRMFLYPFLGFCALHALTVTVVHILIRGYQRDEAVLAAAAATAQNGAAAMRLAMAAGSGRMTAATASAPPPPIQTMSAELVLVIQPDYGCYNGDGGLGRCSGAVAIARRSTGLGGPGGAAALSLIPGSGGAGVRGRAGGGGYSEKGIAWALRYTRTAEGAEPASPSKLTPAPSLGGNGNAEALEPPGAAAEGRGLFSRMSMGSVDGGGGGGGGGRLSSRNADEPTRNAVEAEVSVATAATAPLWRTGSGSVWPIIASPFSGRAAASAAQPPPLGPTSGAGAVHASCARSASIGFPLHQTSGGAMSPCSSPSRGCIYAAVSLRGSPALAAAPLPPHQSPPCSSSSSALQLTSLLQLQLQGSSPPSAARQPCQLQHQLRHRPPHPPLSSCSSSVCGGSPPPSRMGPPRTELSLPTVPASPRWGPGIHGNDPGDADAATDLAAAAADTVPNPSPADSAVCTDRP